jgi:diacylglycerol kinase (ATP)
MTLPDGTVFLVNPAAGSGRAGRVWRRLAAADPRLGGAEVIAAGEPLAARNALDRCLAAGLRRLVVVGGDGSLHLAVNALRAAAAERVVVGLVPAGTGSDFAHAAGLPMRPETALARALGGGVRHLDLVRVSTAAETRWSVAVASAGISGLVDQLVNARAVKGATAYLTATLAALGRYRPFSGRVDLDGERWHQGGVFLLAFANGRAFGKGMRVAPRAVVDDGWADVVLVRPLPRWQVPLKLPRLYLGLHLGMSIVASRRARKLRLEPDGDLPPFDLDGEPMPSGPAEFELAPGALPFSG